MTTTVTFRLKQKYIQLLNTLTSRCGITKTEIVERALDAYALESKKNNAAILTFAGRMRVSYADRLLKEIYPSVSKKSKK